MEPSNEQIARWLDQPTEKDKLERDQWIKLSPDNKRTWLDYQQIWEESQLLGADKKLPNATLLWDGIARKTVSPQLSKIGLILRIAAMLLLFMSLGFSLYFFQSSNIILYEATNEPLNILLADSSVIVLKQNSRLEVPKQFLKSGRNVTLTGDGYFEIKKDTNAPFTITTGDLLVKVLGTSFLVESSQKEEAKVSVYSGRVWFGKAESEGVVIQKGETYVFQQNQFDSSIKDVNELAWFTKRVSYDKAPVSTFVDDMAKHYSIIVMVPNLETTTCVFSAEFESLSVDEMVEAVALTLGGSMRKLTDNRYEIVNTLCGRGSIQ